MKTEVEKILLNVINDFNSKWTSHAEKDTGVSEYAEKIVNLFSQADAISRLVELAKAEYGEFKQEFIGYKVGSRWIDDWDFDIIPFEKIKEESSHVSPITDKDLENLSKSTDEFFYCEDNSVIIRRCYNVINKGWKRELLHLINGL